jgi:hypothetical protein
MPRKTDIEILDDCIAEQERATMPTPIYSLPFHSITQMRAVAGLMRAYVDDNAPDTNEGEDWTPPADLAEVSAAACHLEAAIEAYDKAPPKRSTQEQADLHRRHLDTERQCWADARRIMSVEDPV